MTSRRARGTSSDAVENDSIAVSRLWGFCARQHICYSAYYAITRPSVCPSVRHTGGSVKNSWS